MIKLKLSIFIIILLFALGALPRKGGRPRHLLLLPRRNGANRRGAAHSRTRSAPSAGERGVRAILSAARQSAEWQDIDLRLHVGAVVADEHDERAVPALHIGQRIDAAVGPLQAEIDELGGLVPYW